MLDLVAKYNLLNGIGKRELNDFLDFLLSKQQLKNKGSLSAYKKKILSVSTWNESDISAFKESTSLLSNWKIEEW